MKTKEEILYQNDSVRGRGYKKEDILNAMEEYAKQQWNAALDEAANKVQLTEFASEFLQEGASEAIEKDSILKLKK